MGKIWDKIIDIFDGDDEEEKKKKGTTAKSSSSNSRKNDREKNKNLPKATASTTKIQLPKDISVKNVPKETTNKSTSTKKETTTKKETKDLPKNNAHRYVGLYPTTPKTEPKNAQRYRGLNGVNPATKKEETKTKKKTNKIEPSSFLPTAKPTSVMENKTNLKSQIDNADVSVVAIAKGMKEKEDTVNRWKRANNTLPQSKYTDINTLLQNKDTAAEVHKQILDLSDSDLYSLSKAASEARIKLPRIGNITNENIQDRLISYIYDTALEWKGAQEGYKYKPDFKPETTSKKLPQGYSSWADLYVDAYRSKETKQDRVRSDNRYNPIKNISEEFKATSDAIKENEGIQKARDQLKPRWEEIQNRYGINKDFDDFTYADFEKWAANNNYSYETVKMFTYGSEGDVGYNPERAGGTSSWVANNSATAEQRKDFNFLKQIAENNERYETSQKDLGRVMTGAFDYINSRTLGLTGNIMDKATTYKAKSEGIPEKLIVTPTQMLDTTRQEHPVVSTLGSLAGGLRTGMKGMATVKTALSAIPGFSSLPAWMINGTVQALTFGPQGAIRTATSGGNAQEIALSGLTNAIGSFAGGAAETAVTSKLMDVIGNPKTANTLFQSIQKYGLTENIASGIGSLTDATIDVGLTGAVDAATGADLQSGTDTAIMFGIVAISTFANSLPAVKAASANNKIKTASEGFKDAYIKYVENPTVEAKDILMKAGNELNKTVKANSKNKGYVDLVHNTVKATNDSLKAWEPETKTSTETTVNLPKTTTPKKIVSTEGGATVKKAEETNPQINERAGIPTYEEYKAEIQKAYPGVDEGLVQQRYNEYYKPVDGVVGIKITNVPSELADTVKAIKSRTGIDVVFGNRYIDGKVDANFRGLYDGEKIIVSENATKKDVFDAVITHELTHGIEGTSKYDDIYNYVVNRMFGNDTKAFDEATRLKMDEYKGFGKIISDNEARREVVAENVRKYIFADDIDSIVRSDYTLGQKIYDVITELIYNVKKKFGTSVELDELKAVQRKYRMALEEYKNNNGDFLSADNQDRINKVNAVKNVKFYHENANRITSDELNVKYSLQHNDDIAKNQRAYMEQKKSNITAEELSGAQQVTNAMVDVMMKYSSILPEDKIGKVLTKNGSYDRSVENTTICVRTLAYNEFVDKVQDEIGRPLTQMESFLVSQKLYDIASDPQCMYCYVSLDRKSFNEMLLRYMHDRDSVIDKYNKSDKSPNAISELYQEFLNGRKDTLNMKQRFNKWLDYADNGTQLLSLADIATEGSQRTIQAEGGNLANQLADARKYAQSASWSKIQKDYVAYRDEILKLGDSVVKNLNEHYGLRWYSFSDYSAAFIVENMQQITDASIRGLKGLSYTKDTDFAEIFAPSGMNVNISVFVNRDADGNFYIDERQSANFEKAIELRKEYPNVGIVATVTDDGALRWAGQQEWSDVIIPFHIVRTGTDVADYYKWLNYTDESSDKVGDKDLWNSYVDSLNPKTENARQKVSKNIYPSEHKNDKDTYLNLCQSRGLTPRFARFAGEEWYMKLVNETRLPADQTPALKPKYNLGAANKSFQKFIDKGGYNGGWYKEGVDVDTEAKNVAEDVLAGKKANEVDYGRQDNYNPETIMASRKSARTHVQYSFAPQDIKNAISDFEAHYGDQYRKSQGQLPKVASTETPLPKAGDNNLPDAIKANRERMMNIISSKSTASTPKDFFAEFDLFDLPKTKSGRLKRDITQEGYALLDEIVSTYKNSGLFDYNKAGRLFESMWEKSNKDGALDVDFNSKDTIKGEFYKKVVDYVENSTTFNRKVTPEDFDFDEEFTTDVAKQFLGNAENYTIKKSNLGGNDIWTVVLNKKYPTSVRKALSESFKLLGGKFNRATGGYDFDYDVTATDVETARLKTVFKKSARTRAENEWLADEMYKKFEPDSASKDIKSDVAKNIDSPLYADYSDVDSIVNQIASNQKPVYQLTKEVKKIEKALKPNTMQMDIIERLAKGEYEFESLTKAVQKEIKPFQELIDAKSLLYEVRNSGLKGWKETVRDSFRRVINDFIKNSDDWKDKALKLFWDINTPERNAYDAMGEDAEKFIKLFVEPAKANDAAKKIYSDEMKQKIKDLNISDTELAAAINYREGLTDIPNKRILQINDVFDEVFDKMKNDLNAVAYLTGNQGVDNPKVNLNGNQTREAFSVLLGEKSIKDVESKKTKQFIRLAERHGIDEIHYNGKGEITAAVNIPYVPHGKALTDLQKFKQSLGFSENVTELPGEITGRTETFKPNKMYAPNTKKRHTQKTDYDLRILDNYIDNISEVIFHTSDITKLRMLIDGLRTKYSEGDIQKEIKIAREELDNAELGDFYEYIKERNEKITKHNNMINWLEEYTNIIAGKKYSGDRFAEKELGREIYNFMNAMERNWGVNQTGGNLSSVINQFSQLTSLVAEKDPRDVVKALTDVFFGDTTMLDESDFIISRKDGIRLKESAVEKISNAMFKLPKSAESLVSKFVWQTAYNEAIRTGKTEAQAKVDANRYAGQLMADRTKIGLPVIFSSKNLLIKMFTAFQVEPANTFFHYIKDLPREAKTKGVTWLVKSTIATAILNHMFNETKEKITGWGNVMLDPLDIAIDVYKWLAKKEGVEFTDVISTLGENVGNLPFAQVPMAMAGFDNVGRVPMADAVPNVKEIFTNKKPLQVAEEIADVAGNMFNPLGGYAQLKKSAKGVNALIKGGVYDSSGNLKYPVEPTPGNVIKGTLFGKSAFKESDEFYDNNRKGLTADETREYQYRVEQGEDPTEVYNDIYGKKQQRSDTSLSNEEYNAAVKENVTEFDYGTSLKLQDVYEEYKKYNPKASSLGVPTASRTFSYNGDTYELTVEQCADLQNQYNEKYYNAVNGIINDSSLSNADKYKKIAEARKNVRSEVQSSFAKENFGATGFNETDQAEYEWRVANGEDPEAVYNDIAAENKASKEESAENKAYKKKAEALITPFDTDTHYELENVLEEYESVYGDASTIAVPKAAKKLSVKGIEVELTPEQYAELQNRYNTAYYNAVTPILNDSGLSVKQKYMKISKIRDSVQSQVKTQFFGEVRSGNTSTQSNNTSTQKEGNSVQKSFEDAFFGTSSNGNTEPTEPKDQNQKNFEDAFFGTSSNDTQKSFEDAFLGKSATVDFYKDARITNYNGEGGHKGMDFAIKVNTPIQSTVAGKVIVVKNLGGNSYGKYVVIQDEQGNNHYYAHLNGFNVNVGDYVSRGDLIGYSGSTGNSTGPHLHYEVRTGDNYNKQINPQNYL